MQVIFDTNKNRTVDVFHPERRVGIYSGESIEDMKQRLGVGLEVVDQVDAVERESRAALTPWQEISEKAWWQALECMPPLRWDRDGGAESFFICEPYTADVHSFYVTLRNRFFTARRQLGTSKIAMVTDLAGKILPQLEVRALDPAGAVVTMTPVPMAKLPSDNGEDWTRFAKEPLVLPMFDWQAVQQVHEFMQTHGTDAVFDGIRYLTISANAFWICEPRDWS